MGLWRGTKTFFSKVVDIRIDRWMGMEYVQDSFARTKYILVDLVKPKKAERTESFEEALDRLGLREQDLQQRKREFTQLFYTFLIIGLSIITYGVVMLFQGHAWITIVSIFLSLYAFSQAFRFHFWLFQLKKRKLGCSFFEWFNSEIHSNKPLAPSDED